MTPDLVTVGGLTVDNVIASDGTVALARVGGNAAYSAVGALCWTGSVGIVSIAAASYPRPTLEALRANSILLDGVVITDTVLENCDWFIYDADGNRHERLRSHPTDLAKASFPTDRLSPEQVSDWQEILRHRGPPAEITFSQFRDSHPPRPEQVPASYLGARGVHLAPSRPVVMDGMVPLFARDGRVVTLDPGWQLAELSLDELAPYLSRVDAFLPSEVELLAIVPDTGIETALGHIAARCKGAVAVKLGGKGCMVWDRVSGRGLTIPVVPTRAVDPTGAGDSFSGGFLAGLVETGDPVKAAVFGTVSASFIVGRFGADGALPVDRAACRTRLADHLAIVAASGALPTPAA